ncbi:MAG TPA: IclR family transcriptional regulator [Solirubrobacterales bacterium]|jgi:DNA-binding IclR family transcriptional regulator|nr:IclR family transcriptional regulator [Solirubrobacterales bacterium]
MAKGLPAAAQGSQGRGEGQVVPSVLRAGRILDALASGPPRATLASLSRGLDIPRSSTLALCNSLVETGLLERDPDGLYRLGPHTLELSRAFLSRTDFHSEFQRVVPELGLLAEQTLVCAVLRGRDVVYIGSRAGTSPLGVSYEIGMRLPAHCTATGLSMLSTLADARVEELYAGVELERLTDRSISSVEELLERLVGVRERGYAVDDGETVRGMICIGAPVRDDAGATAGAVAVSVPKAVASKRELPSLAREVQRIADAISRGLGAP